MHALALAAAVPLCMIAMPGPASGQERPPLRAPAIAAPALEPAAMAADLRLLATAIAENHPSAYRYRRKAEIDALFERAAKRLARPMDIFSFYRIVAPVMAGLRDGHSTVRLPAAIDGPYRESAPLLPLRFHLAGGRLYVARDLRQAPGGPVALAGREVESIDGRPVRAILAELTSLLPGDGNIPSSRVAALRTLRFNSLFGLLHGWSDTYRLKLRGVGRAVALRGQPIALTTRIWEQRFPGEALPRPARLAFEDAGATAILSIPSFAGHADLEGKKPLGAFLDEAFATIQARGTGALLIDLRGNGGGRDELGLKLLSFLMDRPFTYYRGLFLNRRDISFASHVERWPGPVPDSVAAPDEQGRLRLTGHPVLGEHRPAERRFGGKVFIVMDGASFSTTAEFLSLAHFQRRATFIGEESGGGYYGDSGGVVLDLTLPNSGLRIRLPMVRYELDVQGFAPADRGVPPDHRVEPLVGDLMSGRDRAMELALSLARRR